MKTKKLLSDIAIFKNKLYDGGFAPQTMHSMYNGHIDDNFLRATMHGEDIMVRTRSNIVTPYIIREFYKASIQKNRYRSLFVFTGDHRKPSKTESSFGDIISEAVSILPDKLGFVECEMKDSRTYMVQNDITDIEFTSIESIVEIYDSRRYDNITVFDFAGLFTTAQDFEKMYQVSRNGGHSLYITNLENYSEHIQNLVPNLDAVIKC